MKYCLYACEETSQDDYIKTQNYVPVYLLNRTSLMTLNLVFKHDPFTLGQEWLFGQCELDVLKINQLRASTISYSMD